jgi:hypothetical protein
LTLRADITGIRRRRLNLVKGPVPPNDVGFFMPARRRLFQIGNITSILRKGLFSKIGLGVIVNMLMTKKAVYVPPLQLFVLTVMCKA